MSTDYGFKCRECDRTVEIDNMRQFAAKALHAVLAGLDKIKAVRSIPMISVEWESGSYSIREALDFAIEHHDMGHTVVVADEYGREDDQCSKQFVCSHCRASEWCRRPLGHSGECGPL